MQIARCYFDFYSFFKYNLKNKYFFCPHLKFHIRQTCKYLLIWELITSTKQFIMKEYMMVFLGADYGNAGLSPEQMQERMGKWFAWGDKMTKAGILKGGEALTPVGKRIVGAKRLVTDSPSAESKELIGGYYTIKVESMDKALEVAQDYPDFDLGGTVEVREIMVFS